MTHRMAMLSQAETANAVQEVALLEGTLARAMVRTSVRTAVRATRAAGRSARRRVDGRAVRGLESAESRIEVRVVARRFERRM
jgi:hypothetical protein